mgnify:CR=1 FL=1
MKFVILFLAATLFQNLYAHQLTLFVTLNPAGSFEATTAKLKGEVKKNPDNSFSSEQLWVRIDDFDTGIELRTEHFKKHLNMSQFPKITLKKIEAKDGKGKGTLSVNNVTQDIEFTYVEKNPTTIEATFKTKNSLFKLPSASYMGIGVEDEVKINATITL